MACGTALGPREVGRLGDREATGAGDRATLGRSPATRWVTGGGNQIQNYFVCPANKDISVSQQPKDSNVNNNSKNKW